MKMFGTQALRRSGRLSAASGPESGKAANTKGNAGVAAVQSEHHLLG